MTQYLRPYPQVIHPHRLPRSAAPSPSLAPAVGEAVVRFKVTDWLLEEGETVCVTGALPQLGSWQQDQMLRLTGGCLGCVVKENSYSS